ncbi:unnamed protein product, partial [Ectocarpus fasciculatus]
LRRLYALRLRRYASVSTKAHLLLCRTSHQPLPQQVVEINEDETSVCVRDPERPHKSIECAFDKVFASSSTQDDIFLGLVPALDTVVKGFNACVLAYGQTGSGKTHTLIGPGGGTRLSDDQTEWGIIPRAVQFLFDRLNLESEEDETFSYSVTCSFLQIYNENLVDLLLHSGGAAGAAASSAPLQIREEAGGGDRGGRGGGGGHRSSVSSCRRRPWSNASSRGGEDETGGGMNGEDVLFGAGRRQQNRASPIREGGKANVFVNGLSSFRVGGAQDVLRYVNLGAANRRVRATQHNEASSRSHAVMQLTVEVKSGGRGGEEGGGGSSDHITYRQAKLSLVDLAGSEKMDSTLSISKGHFKELRSINQSLSTLGNVVSALSEKGRTHVPYRDSKLTRLLQDSLGGNTRTTIIACVNPLAGQTHETINTLQFADRAKKVMVRLRANEVVDDRVLLARARAEIKRLKRRLREALEGTLLGTAAENDDNDGHCPNESSRSCLNHDRNGTPEETNPRSENIDVASPGGAGGGPAARGVKEEGGKEHSILTSRVVANNPAQHSCLRSVSPSQAAAAVPSSALRLPKFRKRQFAVDGGRGQDSGGEGEPVEDALTAEEVQAIVSNSAEAQAASGSPEQKMEEEQDVEDAKQLAMFRREIQEGVVSGSLVKRGGRGGRGQGAATVPVKSGDAVGVDGDGENDGDSVNGNPDEQADIEVFIDQSQRLEDLMFEAQGRERRRLRGTNEPSVARFPTTSSSRADANGGQGADVKIAFQQRQDQHQDRRGQQQQAPPCYDGALAAPHTCNLMATATPPVLRALGSKEKGISINIGDDGGQIRTGWTDQSSKTTRGTPSLTNGNPTPTPATTATTTAMMMAVLASPETPIDSCETYDPHKRANNNNNNNGSSNDNSAVEAFAGERVQRAVLTIKPPLERRRRQRQAGAQHQNPTPSSPSSLHRSPFPSPSVQRRRPATSTGGPPTGSNRARSSSRRIYQRKVGGCRSPVGGKPSAFLEPASPQIGPHDGGSEEHRPRRRQEGKLGSGDGGGGGSSATKVAATHPRLARSSPEQKKRFGKEFLRADADDQRKRGLSYSVADLGLRLKVYSFRYDHYYECQVVGYDSRRRMHRCAYDATGEKQWHDLASKRFEVVGQNGVIVRSTESAPPAPASLATTATNPTPSLLLPTSPSNIVGAMASESGGGQGAPGRKHMLKM